MNSAVIQLLVLAGVAVFMILKLKDVLGTRDGFEKPPRSLPGHASEAEKNRAKFEVIDGGPDRDITDHVGEDSDAAQALAKMKKAEPSFSVSEFLSGASGAYEMILMAFERGDLDQVRGFVSDEVYDAFNSVVQQRTEEGITIEAEFIGVREMSLNGASFDDETGTGEVSVRFLCELTSVVRDKGGDVIEGDASHAKRQKDTWTFARVMGADDPNWQLVATAE
jgi:predicted lipid-binding transport protein (Tim44 family)